MSEWPLNRIRVGRRFRKALGDLRALAESVGAVGLLHPVVVTPQGRLVAGRRRLEAVRLLGWRTISVHVVDLENIIEGELAENVHRKDFLPSELWAIAKKVKERVKTPVGRRSEKVENCHHCNGKTRDKAAAYFGVSGRHLDKIGAVCEGEFPELVTVYIRSCGSPAPASDTPHRAYCPGPGDRILGNCTSPELRGAFHARF